MQPSILNPFSKNAPLTARPLKPALVLGSGFHRHVFGDGGPSSARTLYDWDHLVSEVSAAMQVAAPSQAMPPVQRWETLLLRAAREGFKDHQGHWHAPATTPAYAIEAMARRHVVDVIKKASENYPLSARARIPLLPQWGAVISLNFDVAWLGAAGNQRARPARDGTTVSQLLTTHTTSRERKRLCERIDVVNSSDDSPNTGVQRVWFPNGNVNDPTSIRMGLQLWRRSVCDTERLRASEAVGTSKPWHGYRSRARRELFRHCAST